MTIEVIDADGTVIEFPDGTPQEQIASVMRSRSQQRASAPGSVIGADVGASSLTPEQEGRVARVRQGNLARDAVDRVTPFGIGPLVRPFADMLADPTKRQRIGSNVSGTIGREYQRQLAVGRERASRGDPLALREIGETFRRTPGDIAQAAQQAPGQVSRAVAAVPGALEQVRRPDYGSTVSSAPRWEQELAARPAPERARGLRTAITESQADDDIGGMNEIARVLARASPGVAGDIGREITYGPFEDERQLQGELDIARAFGAPEEELEALADEGLRRTGAAGINLAFAPFDAALVAKGGAQALRSIPRGAPGGARPRGAPSPGRPPRPRPRPSAAQARAAAALQEWEAGRPVRQLEREFGDMTAGERAGDPYAMSREETLRRAGAGQPTMRGFDEARSEQIRESLMRRIATRGLDPQNPDVASAGNTLVDALRTQYDDLKAVQQGWYDEAMRLGADDAIAPTDELLNNVQAVGREHFGNLDSAAMSIVRDLHQEIASGQATYARIERARQALNAELRTAMASGDGRQVDAIHRIIDELDAFAEPRVSEPTRQAILEARKITQEIGDMYGQQLRPELATGHVGRRDLGGQVLRGLRETDIADEAVMNRVFGAGAKPGERAFSTVRRISENARRQLATEGVAPTGVPTGQSQRLAGRRALEGRRTKGERTFDPTPAERALRGVELPREDLQALRETFVYRLASPLEAGSPVPFGELATRLRHALTSSRSTTEQMFNAQEIATLERALEYMQRATLPKGAYAPSAPGIAEDALQRGAWATAGRLLGRIPGMEGVGEAIRAGIVNARNIREARAAIARPTIPREAVKGRLQRMTSQQAAQRRVQPPPAAAPAPLKRPPRPPRPPTPGGPSRAPAALRTGSPPRPRGSPRVPSALLAAGLGAGALASGGEAQAQEVSPELAEVRTAISKREEDAALIGSVSRNRTHADVMRVQQILQGYGLYGDEGFRPDGQWGQRTTNAVREFGEQLKELQGQEAYLSTRPDERQQLMRGPGGIVAPLGAGIAAGFLTRGGIAKIPAWRRNALLTRRDLLPLPPAPAGNASRATRARAEAARRDVRSEATRRAANLNEFWRLGGAGERTPFTTPERGLFARSRKRAADPSSLYPPSRSASRFIPDAAVVSLGAGEAATMEVLLHDARRERDAARAAVATPEGRNRANFQRLETAIDRVTTLETWQRAGMGLASGHLAAMKLVPRGRPNVALAERERFRLNQFLSEGGGKP